MGEAKRRKQNDLNFGKAIKSGNFTNWLDKARKRFDIDISDIDLDSFVFMGAGFADYEKITINYLSEQKVTKEERHAINGALRIEVISMMNEHRYKGKFEWVLIVKIRAELLSTIKETKSQMIVLLEKNDNNRIPDKVVIVP